MYSCPCIGCPNFILLFFGKLKRHMASRQFVCLKLSLVSCGKNTCSPGLQGVFLRHKLCGHCRSPIWKQKTEAFGVFKSVPGNSAEKNYCPILKTIKMFKITKLKSIVQKGTGCWWKITTAFFILQLNQKVPTKGAFYKHFKPFELIIPLVEIHSLRN